MAYAPRPDGLNDLILDDGTRIASPLPIAQLEEMGHRPIEPMPQGPGLDPNATAEFDAAHIQGMLNAPQQPMQQPGYGPPPPPSALDASGGYKIVGEMPSVNGKERPQFQAGIQQLQAEAPQTQKSTAPKRNLVPLGGAGYAQPGAGVPGYAPQRVTKIKGGDMRASFTRVPGQEVPQDVKDDALNEDAEDVELSADVIATQREELRMKRESQLLEQQKMLDRQQAQRQHVDQQIAGKQSLIDQRDREIEKTRPQSVQDVIDDRGFLGRIGAALIMAVGGYNAGLTGGPNQGYQMVRESIMDEVASQRAAYEDAKERGETARNDYARAISMYGTPEAASLDMEMRRIGVAEKVLENRASKIQDQEYLQQAGQVANQLRAQRAETKMKLLELEKGKVVQENWQYVPDRYVGSGGPPKVKKEDGERLVRMPDGTYKFARDATQARKLQDVVKANDRLSTLAGRLKSLTDTVGKREPTAAERAAGDTIKSEMMFTYKDASQAGALDKGLQDAMEGYFGKATDMFRIEDVPRKLDEVKRIADSKVREVDRYDLHPTPDYAPGSAMRPPGESDE
jgi:hypothetical protein